MRTRRPGPAPVPRPAFAGFCFPPEVIVLAVRWYLRFSLSYRDVEELLAKRGIEVDHVTVYRAIDQAGQVIDVFASSRRDSACARRFFQRALGASKTTPREVTTDLARRAGRHQPTRRSGQRRPCRGPRDCRCWRGVHRWADR